MKKSLLIVLIILGGFSLYAQETSSYVLQNVYARDYQTLNGSWNYIVDPFDNGYYDYRMNINRNGFFRNQKQANPSDLVEYNFDTAPCLQVPGDWNTQEDRLFFYEGSIWYKRDFNFKPQEGKRQFIYFGAVNYFCNIYLNGREIATHEGGFTPFSIEVTDRLKEGNNFLILRVNNERHAENVPTVNFDWWNYGGITRDVMLVSLPTLFVDDYQLRLKKGSYKELEGYVCLSEAQAGVELNLEIPELKVKQKVQTDEQGRAEFSIKAKPELWSPQTPKLYRVILRQGDEVIEDKIGFRQITTEGNKILLNGKQVFLSGVSIHEEAPYRQGRIFSKEESVLLLSWAKEMGCNFVRLAHYPHNEHMVRAAEEMGLMVWSEIPVYWTIAWENQDTYKNASRQLRDMMNRDKNRCAVVVWSVANETPHSEPRDKFLIGLANQVREKDDSRLLSMAMEVTGQGNNISRVRDNMSDYVDIISVNTYLGWYGGSLDAILNRSWEIPYDKPVFFSEYGAGALQGLHGDENVRWTEEYQERLYKNSIEMFDKVEGFSGMSPWILMDFRSTRRQLKGVQDFFNRKGVISERGIRKKAFYVLQNYYKSKDY